MSKQEKISKLEEMILSWEKFSEYDKLHENPEEIQDQKLFSKQRCTEITECTKHNMENVLSTKQFREKLLKKRKSNSIKSANSDSSEEFVRRTSLKIDKMRDTNLKLTEYYNVVKKISINRNKENKAVKAPIQEEKYFFEKKINFSNKSNLDENG